MFRATAERVAHSGLSLALQDIPWVVPVSQSIHIVALSVLFASAMLINLRLLGANVRGRSASQLAASLLPWMWRALAVAFCTGLLQTFIEPVRQFITPIFWFKMLLIVALALLTLWFSRSLRANAATWDSPHSPPGVCRVFAIVSTLGWLTVIVFGRFIGYVWSYYL